MYFNSGNIVENINIRMERKYKFESNSIYTDWSIDKSLEIIKTVFIFIIGKYILIQNIINDIDNNNLCEILYIVLMKIMTFSKSVF